METRCYSFFLFLFCFKVLFYILRLTFFCLLVLSFLDFSTPNQTKPNPISPMKTWFARCMAHITSCTFSSSSSNLPYSTVRHSRTALYCTCSRNHNATTFICSFINLSCYSFFPSMMERIFRVDHYKSEALRDMSSYVYVLYATLTNDVCGDCDCDWVRVYDCRARRSPITCCMALALLLVVVCNSGSWRYGSDGALCLVHVRYGGFGFSCFVPWLFARLGEGGTALYCTLTVRFVDTDDGQLA